MVCGAQIRAGATGQMDEPVPLTGAFPATALSRLGDLVLNPMQRPPRTFVAVPLVGTRGDLWPW
jgi:hypothetical protein